MREVAIVGIGMHAFGRHEGVSGLEQGVIAAQRACRDAGLAWHDIAFAVGGSRDAGHPDRMVSRLGLSGLPFLNVINGCATGAAALIAACNMIRSGSHDLGMVVGFDKHARGAFVPSSSSGADLEWYGASGLALTTQFFAMRINRYMERHGIGRGSLARVATKAYRNGERNPMAWRRRPLTAEEILAAPMLSHPLTQYMLCSPAEGAVALVLCRADLAHRYPKRPIFLRAVSMRSRRFGSFEVLASSLAREESDGPTVDASREAFEQAAIGPEDLDLAQLQDTDAGSEIIHMAENGLCEHGDQERMLERGETEIGGSLPVNTDGGCLASGEPIGASGLRQVYENVLQLRGEAGARQVPGHPRVAYSHVYGSPGISGVTIVAR